MAKREDIPYSITIVFQYLPSFTEKLVVFFTVVQYEMLSKQLFSYSPDKHRWCCQLLELQLILGCESGLTSDFSFHIFKTNVPRLLSMKDSKFI